MPMIEPASVICEAPCRAIPKSVTFSRGSFAFTCWSAETSTLCGLMSRWMIPWRCAKRSASRSCLAYPIAVCDRERAARHDQLLEAAALDHLHGDVVRALGLAAVVDGDDVRVREPGCRLRLAAEALDEEVVARVALVEDLDRDAAPELLVLGEVDVGHAAGAELPQDPVAAVEERVDEGVRERRP